MKIFCYPERSEAESKNLQMLANVWLPENVRAIERSLALLGMTKPHHVTAP